MNDTELDQLLDTWQAPAPSPALRRTTLAAFPRDYRIKIAGVPLKWLVAATLAAGSLAVGTSLWSNPELGNYFQGSANGIYVRVARRIDPPQAKIHWWFKGGGGSIGDAPGGGIAGSSFMRDRAAGKFYGFRYQAVPLGGGTYQVTFAPFDEAALYRGGPIKVTGDIVQAAPIGPPQFVQDGGYFDSDIYVADGVRIYDRVDISSKPFPKPAPPSAAEQQQIDAIRMQWVHPRLYLNGTFAAKAAGGGSGGCLWIHLPGEGRYLIAVNPFGAPNFVQAGHVNGNLVEFTSEGHQFRVETDAPVAAGGDRPVYVFHQQSFENELDLTNPLAHQVMFGNAGPASMQK
jgi:hypothetical protein